MVYKRTVDITYTVIRVDHMAGAVCVEKVRTTTYIFGLKAKLVIDMVTHLL